MMERIVKFYPAFDKRQPDPKKDYGIHGVELLMLLKGEKGAVQFILYTNWMLPHVQNELDSKPTPNSLCKPFPTDLGYHSPVPKYESQSTITKSCEWLDGKPCYYDGSSLAADKVFKDLLAHGSDGVWADLEEYYQHTFGVLQ